MIEIEKKTPQENWQKIRQQFYQSLTMPFDGMWDEIVHKEDHLWGFYDEGKIVGYCSVDEKKTLLNFYLDEAYQERQKKGFERVLFKLEVQQALVNSSNPDFLIMSLEKSRKMAVHTHLFEDHLVVNLPPPPYLSSIDCKHEQITDVPKLVDFCAKNMAGDREWLAKYLSRLVERKEIFALCEGEEIIGTYEVRKSDTQEDIADLGVIVDEEYRARGIGSYLMSHAKASCYLQGLIPICSCKQENVASKKMIENAGFLSKNMMLKITF